MLSSFFVYLELGFRHILDLQGYDHILFVIALVAGEGRRFKRLIWLVTAFTVGHSITLALATLNIVSANPAWIEFLIPVTIVLTSAINIHQAEHIASDTSVLVSERIKYALALLFGLIHGLGFSNFLRAALGAEESLFIPLLGFNIGVEIGQLMIVLCTVAVAAAALRSRRIGMRDWILIVSGATGGIALVMALERIPF